MQQSVRTNLEEGNEIYFQELNNYIRSYYVSSACPMPGARESLFTYLCPGFPMAAALCLAGGGTGWRHRASSGTARG